jgi:prepilin-type N-terminal cleavage/methylation domain-containing protein
MQNLITWARGFCILSVHGSWLIAADGREATGMELLTIWVSHGYGVAKILQKTGKSARPTCRRQKPTTFHKRTANVSRHGWTLIELLAVIFVIAVTTVIGSSVANARGPMSGIGAAFAVGTLCVISVILFYRWMWRSDQRGLQKAREDYREIYRVLTVPTAPKIVVVPEGAEIRIEDYGWEAGPTRNDGLIYLQGLTMDWTVVWHAGLRPDEVEKVATKPNSQYDSWHPFWADPPPLAPCPFPVVDRETVTIGRPHHSHRYFVQPTTYRPQGTVPQRRET